MLTRLTTTIATAILLSLAASAQTEAPDTVAIFEGNGNLTITTTSGGGKVITFSEPTADGRMRTNTYTIDNTSRPRFFDGATPSRWDISKILNRNERRAERRPRTATTGAVGIYAGGLIPTGSHGAITGGWEIGVNNLIMGEWLPGRGLPSLAIGLGFGWEMQTVGHGAILNSEHGRLFTLPAPTGIHDVKSRIRRFHFTIPLTVTIPIHRKFQMTLSPELHLNTYTTASASFSDNDGRHTSLSFKGLHQKIATVDLTAGLGFREAIGVYVTYSPMKPWKEGYGPQYHTIAVGASLNF